MCYPICCPRRGWFQGPRVLTLPSKQSRIHLVVGFRPNRDPPSTANTLIHFHSLSFTIISKLESLRGARLLANAIEVDDIRALGRASFVNQVRLKLELRISKHVDPSFPPQTPPTDSIQQAKQCHYSMRSRRHGEKPLILEP